MGINHEDSKVQRGDQEDAGFLRNEATNADGMPVCRGVWKTGPVQPPGIYSHIEVEWLLLTDMKNVKFSNKIARFDAALVESFELYEFELRIYTFKNGRRFTLLAPQDCVDRIVSFLSHIENSTGHSYSFRLITRSLTGIACPTGMYGSILRTMNPWSKYVLWDNSVESRLLYKGMFLLMLQRSIALRMAHSCRQWGLISRLQVKRKSVKKTMELADPVYDLIGECEDK